nr:hypothetical protein BCU07_18020 [Vibrio sp. 10N.261.54.E10]
MARNTIDALQITAQLAQKKAGLVFHDLCYLELNSYVGRIIYTTKMERKHILQRCNEGVGTKIGLVFSSFTFHENG